MINEKFNEDIPTVFVKVSGDNYVVPVCPYCGNKHFHGKLEGHRLCHCGQEIYRKGEFIDLKQIDNSNGYFLRLPLIEKLLINNKK